MSEDENKINLEELANLSTKEILANLTAREAKALRDKFGIHLSNEYGSEEIGRQFEVTRKRIQEIEAKALRKLKNKNAKALDQSCSFCRKSINDVKKLIKSEINNVYICDECIKTCGDLLDDQ